MKKRHELFAEHKHIFGGSFPETGTADHPVNSRTPLLANSQDSTFVQGAQLKLLASSDPLVFMADPVTQFWTIVFYKQNSFSE